MRFNRLAQGVKQNAANRLRAAFAARQQYRLTAHVTAAPPPVSSIFDMFTNQPPRVPLDVPYPGVNIPEPSFVSDNIVLPSAKLSTLPSGIRVVTLPSHHPLVTIGVHIEGGIRRETAAFNGVHQLLEIAAFKKHNQAVRTRYYSRYAGDVRSLTESIIHPAYLPDEWKEIQNTYARDYQDKFLEVPDTRLVEALFATAYHNNTLGRTAWPLPDVVSQFTPSLLMGYVSSTRRPEDIVVGAVGIANSDHDTFAEEVESAFSDFTTTFSQNYRQQNLPPAQYTGGETLLPLTGPKIHYAIAYEGANWKSNDLIATCVLQNLLGGGSSFSAGGPGKGMYTRLYSNVLNAHGWIDSAMAFQHLFSDTGLFGIQASANGDRASDLVDVIQAEFEHLSDIHEEEVPRAKNLLKNAVLYTMENRQAQLEDLVKTVSVYGKPTSEADLLRQIDAVTADDIKRVARNLTQGKRTVVAVGDISHAPRVLSFL